MTTGTQSKRIVWRDALWVLPGVAIGLGLLAVQQLGVHRMIVLAAGLISIGLVLVSQHRLRLLLGLFFITIVLNPDKYLSLVYGCSWSDGINLSAMDVMAGLIVAVFYLEGHFARLKARAPQTAFFDRQVDVPMLLLAFAALLSIKNSVNLTASLYLVFELVKLYGFYWFFRRLFATLSPISVLVMGLCVLVGVEFVFFLFELAGRGFALGGFRFSGTYSNPNAFAQLMAPISVLLLAYFVVGPAGRLKLASLLCSGLSLLMLQGSFSRGGWISAAAAYGLFLVILVLRGRLDFRYLVWIGLLMGLLGVVFHQQILARLHFDDASAHSRIYLNAIAWHMIQAYPILGIGANTFPFVMKEFYYPGLQVHEWLHTVHNQYLLVWSEMGILGIVSFLWLLWGSIVRAFGNLRGRNDDLSIMGLALALALLASSIHMLVDMFVAPGNLVLMWLYFAALAHLVAGVKRREELVDVA